MKRKFYWARYRARDGSVFSWHPADAAPENAEQISEAEYWATVYAAQEYQNRLKKYTQGE